MNKIKILVIMLFAISTNPLYADTKVCNEYKKTTKEYAKCTAGKFKKKFKKFKLNDKLLKFKNSKSHKELMDN
jgi:hypothetical protein